MKRTALLVISLSVATTLATYYILHRRRTYYFRSYDDDLEEYGTVGPYVATWTETGGKWTRPN